MAIGTYSELQTAIANWSDRADLTARIPEYITLAESRLNRELRLRVMESDQPLTGVVDSRNIALPSGFIEPLALWLEGANGRVGLRFVPAEITSFTASGQPKYWTVNGTNISFERPCDAAYSFTLRMLQSFALSDSSPTNWLLTNHPDAYLLACRLEVGDYLFDDAALQKAEARLVQAIDQINNKEGRSRSLATLSVDCALRPHAHPYNINTGL